MLSMGKFSHVVLVMVSIVAAVFFGAHAFFLETEVDEAFGTWTFAPSAAVSASCRDGSRLIEARRSLIWPPLSFTMDVPSNRAGVLHAIRWSSIERGHEGIDFNAKFGEQGGRFHGLLTGDTITVTHMVIGGSKHHPRREYDLSGGAASYPDSAARIFAAAPILRRCRPATETAQAPATQNNP